VWIFIFIFGVITQPWSACGGGRLVGIPFSIHYVLSLSLLSNRSDSKPSLSTDVEERQGKVKFFK